MAFSDTSERGEQPTRAYYVWRYRWCFSSVGKIGRGQKDMKEIDSALSFDASQASRQPSLTSSPADSVYIVFFSFLLCRTSSFY